MRILVRLRADADAVYNPEYHNKLRGVIWDALSGTPFYDLHGERSVPAFCFSNIFPVKQISEGDIRHVLIASHREGLIRVLADRFEPGTEFNVGEMAFHVDDCSVLSPDVGETGTSGTLKTDTGVYIPLPQERWDEYGIETEANAEQIGWSPDYSLEIFLERVRENLAWKHDTIHADYLETVSPETELFTDLTLEKTYTVDVAVTSDNTYEYTFLVTKWKFDYTVRNEDHRRWLNLLLDTGMGWRNQLGFGFVNREVAE
ncbi:CRISPR-associated endoribonuclease Cas6 [Natronolimnohabitans sp. A-GB9]|uniref:CRISPR-associated endoribonuclease Cas6 n=1 Tax=Natronolimnohabitans sp. A-GB9 TaxID=3069757 RepID=UPI0027AE2A4C|nr:CRISPR-associated endoribonuclease Cas6 [Natronolimnohabitans sp. A-GB9]MDQ2052830.1 CRISPR-associated endoribonuclease Cas6 [Natronolimnohabitans sp. A-GB9]